MKNVIICNGLYKTGSTILYDSLKTLDNNTQSLQRSAYNSKNFKLTSINIDKIKSSECVVFKTHVYDRSLLDLLKKKDNVLIIFTYRDMREIIRSHYHHFSNENFNLPYSFYLISVGLIKAIECNIYINNVSDKCDLIIDYKSLKSPEVAARILSPYLGRFSITDIENSFITTLSANKKDKIAISGMKNRGWFYDRKEKHHNLLITNIENLIIKIAKYSWFINFASNVLFYKRMMRQYKEFTNF